MENIKEVTQKTKCRITIWPSIPLLGIYPDKTVIQKDTDTLVFTAELHTAAKTWKEPKVQWELNGQRWLGAYLMEYYPPMKEKEWNNATVWMDLEIIKGFSGGSGVKNPPAMQETRVCSLGWEDPLEKGLATHSRILAWERPWTEKPGGLQSMGLQKSWTWLSDYTTAKRLSC